MRCRATPGRVGGQRERERGKKYAKVVSHSFFLTLAAPLAPPVSSSGGRAAQGDAVLSELWQLKAIGGLAWRFRIGLSLLDV